MVQTLNFFLRLVVLFTIAIVAWKVAMRLIDLACRGLVWLGQWAKRMMDLRSTINKASV